MIKRGIALCMAVVLAMGLLTGCNTGGADGLTEVSDEYIKIKQFGGLEVQKVEVAQVTEGEIDRTIEVKLGQTMTTEEVTGRAVETGDTVTVSFVGKIDDVPFEGGTGTSDLKIGSGNFIEGFEEGLIGVNIGETVDLPLTFPEEYQAPDLAGKDAVFTATIDKISVEVMPELTDEWVKTVSEVSGTVEEFRAEVKEMLEADAEANAKGTLSSEIWIQLMDNTEVIQLPEERLEIARTNYRSQYEQMSQYYGVTLEEFLAQTMQMTEEDFEELVETEAANMVTRECIIFLIAKKAGLEPTKEEYQARWEEMLETYNMESVEALMEAATETTLKLMMLSEIVETWLTENTIQVDEVAAPEATEEAASDAPEEAEEEAATE